MQKKPDENKICTICVDEHFSDKGIGTSSMQEMLEWLGEEYPVITVQDAKIKTLTPILKRFNFNLVEIQTGLYIPHRIEFIFNSAYPKI